MMIHDELVEIFGAKFACVDKGFGTNQPVDVVIRPEDIDLVKPEEGTLQGIVTHLIFKGVHYEMEVTTPDGYEWLVHSTDMFPVGREGRHPCRSVRHPDHEQAGVRGRGGCGRQ